MTSKYPPNDHDPRMLGAAPLSPYTGIPGWLTEKEQGALLTLASGLPDSRIPTIVEIGSELGQSASILAIYCPVATVVCIDINKDAPFEENLLQIDCVVDAIYADSTTFNWEEYSYGKYIHDHVYFTDEFKFSMERIDLLFIDGDHSESAVKKDLENFAPYIVQGGYLVLHDCACATNKLPHKQHHAVSASLHHWLADYGSQAGFRHLFSVDSMMIFRRMHDEKQK